jgi:hypothetical protein
MRAAPSPCIVGINARTNSSRSSRNRSLVM